MTPNNFMAIAVIALAGAQLFTTLTLIRLGKRIRRLEAYTFEADRLIADAMRSQIAAVRLVVRDDGQMHTEVH